MSFVCLYCNAISNRNQLPKRCPECGHEFTIALPIESLTPIALVARRVNQTIQIEPTEEGARLVIGDYVMDIVIDNEPEPESVPDV